MSNSASGLRDHIGYWMRRLSDQVRLSFERQLADHDVTVAQWNVLVSVYRGEGRTVGQLARFIDTDVAAVSRLVDRLGEKGLITRTADPSSRRRILLALTPRATTLVPELIELADRNDDAFFGSLPPTQREELLALLQQLLHHDTTTETNRETEEHRR